MEVIPDYIRNRHTVRYVGDRALEIIEDENLIVDLKQSVYNPSNNYFPAGSHELRFQIQTPPTLPNTFLYTFSEHMEKFKAEIKYQVAAALIIPGTNEAIVAKAKLDV